MHIIAEESQQTSDNCKYSNDLTVLLAPETVVLQKLVTTGDQIIMAH